MVYLKAMDLLQEVFNELKALKANSESVQAQVC